MAHGVQGDDEGRSFFTLDVDFPVAPFEPSAGSTVPDQHPGETESTESGDSR